MGPNEKKLISRRMALIMIPSNGGLSDGLKALQGDLPAIAREATAWVKQAIEVVKMAPDNPWKTDEEIAGAILEKM